MNSSIKKLSTVASKPTKRIIGLMSGTSLDGLDIALCEIGGSGVSTKVKLNRFETISYDASFKKRLKAITSVPKASVEEITILHSHLGDLHGKFILELLEKWGVNPTEIDCIASHGQTLYHAPKRQHQQDTMPNATLQIGDGDHIARKTGILTISDFRQKHTAAGGEGAPMTSLVDEILFTHNSKNRILLNIGGIANFTYLPAKSNSGQHTITTDTGPGNTLIDAAMQEYFDQEFDKNGAVAKKGSVQADVLDALRLEAYFKQSLPKTTGPEVFNLDWVTRQLKEANINFPPPEDLVATLTQLTIDTIAESIQKIIHDNQYPTIYVSGGGLHNPLLMDGLAKQLPNCPIESFASIGFNPDAKEAVVFAVLANEMLSGDGFVTDLEPEQPINFGKISFPD